jgi:PKD repeat protein
VRRLLSAAVVLAGLAFAPAASAALVQLGATEPPGSSDNSDCSYCTDFQYATAAGAPVYIVPAGDAGVITSWTILAPNSSDGCNMCSIEMFLVAPTATAGTWKDLANSASEDPGDNGQLHTYTVDFPVQPGDAIGLEYNYVPAYLTTGVSGDKTADYPCDLNAGTTCAVDSPDNDSLLSVAATLVTPSASFTASSGAIAGSPVSFNGSASTSAAAITGYSWSFGDGASATGATATHTYASAGSYTASLTITDANSDSNTTSETVNVAAPPPPTFLGSTLSSTSLPTTKSGKVTLALACSSTAVTSCSDAVALYAGSGALPASAKAAKRYASGQFTIASGASATETLTMNAAGRKLIAKKAHLPARLTLSATDGDSRSFDATVSVTLKRTASPKHHHHHARIEFALLAREL